jgi:DamX protein
MPALANTQINQNKINQQADRLAKEDKIEISVTDINVIARIDYIQRFSKHMAVVVDENPAVYSKVARQYLANLSQTTGTQDMNVAFLAASNKINDIQMRCRLIEQLFANTLFDPEQSLAVSILRLAKQNNGIITVVVEHAQALSLQIKYELCQLVDTAKKTQNNVNVVIFGLEQTGIEIGQNRTIFDKKASIVDASSGQVIALDHARFKNKPAVFKSSVWLKLSLASLVGLVLVMIIGFLFSEYKNVNFAALPATTINENSKALPQKVRTITSQSNLASVSDVQFALLSKENSQQLFPEKAERNDILQALTLTGLAIKDERTSHRIEKSVSTSPIVKVTPIIEQIQPTDLKLEQNSSLAILPVVLNEQYYLNSEKGYVVQITGFSDLSRLEAFIENNNELDYFSYHKNLNAQKFFVLTTKIYSDKVQAGVAMDKLPQSIKDLGSFLKSVSTIKREINTVSR